MSPVVVFPFHQDERLGSLTLPAEYPTVIVDPGADPDGTDQWARLRGLYEALARTVAEHLMSGGFTAVVSGDCLSMLGTFAGAQRAGLDPSLIWFDAHGDVHTLASSESGYLGGTALRMVVGGDPERLAGPLGLTALSEDRVVLVDARDLDPAEASYLDTAGIHRRSVADLSAGDLPAGPIVLHLDVDVIDSAAVPGLRFPVPGGPSRSAAIAAVRRLLATGRVAVLDIACPWEDPVDDEQEQVRRALLAELLAHHHTG